MHIRAVLFDWDGTLTYPGSLDFPAIKRSLGCPPLVPILEYLETLPLEDRQRSMEILNKEEMKSARASRPNRGALECLRDFKKRALPMGILTRNSLRSVEEALARFDGFGVEDFASIITREACRPKPHPDGVLMGAKSMGVNPGELMVVGDFRFDVMAGKAAGAVTVLLTNGNPSPMLPEDPGPDHVIEHLDGLLSLLPRIPLTP
jgi:HAD superfamily hydrolase (TIGR01509 family)